MSRWPRRCLLLAIVSCALASLGCFQMGTKGRLSFAIKVDDEILGFDSNLRLAEGSSAELLVRGGSARDVSIRSAMTTDGRVLEVGEVTPRVIHIKGLADGDAVLMVLADGLSDSVPILVRRVAKVNVRLASAILAAQGPDGVPVAIVGGAALVGHHAHFAAEVLDSTDHRLLAPGAIPVAIIPAEAGRILQSAHSVASFDVVFDAPGEAIVGSQLPPPQQGIAEPTEGATAGAVVRVRVVRPEDVERIRVAAIAPVDGKGSGLKDAVLLAIEIEVGGAVMPLLSGGVALTPLTPDVCASIKDGEGLGALLATLLGTGIEPIVILASGTCSVKVEIAGHEATYSAEVEKSEKRSR